MANTSLFASLKRIFSSDVVIRNVGGKQLKVADINQIQTTGRYETNALVDRFTRLYSYNNRNIFNPSLNYQTLRIQLYSDYEAMDTDPIIMSALDIIASDTTVRSDMGEILSIKSSDENIQRVLYNLYYDIMNIEFNLWSWVRNMCKYGDFFLKLEIAEEFGVYNVIPYTVYHMSRLEGVDEDEPNKVIFQLDPDGMAGSSDPTFIRRENDRIITFDNYEVAHFRLISDTNYLPYGRSYLEPARKIYKQVVLMEDAMLLHRIMRAPEKRIFYINVGQIPPAEVDNFMQKTINTMKKTPFIGPDGEYNLRFNMQNMMEDFYIPIRGGDTSSRIETAEALNYNGIEDIDYLLRKMFAALKIPKAYFGYDGELSGKATLAAEDIRFATTVERVQRIIESELTKIGLVHLYAQGFKKESLTNFEIRLTTPSVIFEQEKVALLKEKVDLTAQMLDTNLFPSDYIYENIFNLSEDQYNEMRDLVVEDKKRMFRLQQIEAEGNDPVESGRSYGTPHDLASMYGRRSTATAKESQMNVPPGYEDMPDPDMPFGHPGPEGGRPREHFSIYGTQKDPVGGRDRLGQHAMKGGYPSDNANVQERVEKQICFGKKVESEEVNLLKEENVRDLED